MYPIQLKTSILLLIAFHFISYFANAQIKNFKCEQLLEKHQSSNRFFGYNSGKSEEYFYKQYCSCLQNSGDTTTLNNFKYITNLTAFSGGYAQIKTYWYSAIVDSNYKELSKSINLESQYLGYGFYAEKQFGQLKLFNAMGHEISTPKMYRTITVLYSDKLKQVFFCGLTGLTCDVFSEEGRIKQSWEGINRIEVLSNRLLMMYRNLPPKSEFDYGIEVKALYNAELVELLPFTSLKFNLVKDNYIFVTEQNKALVFDFNGQLQLTQMDVQYRDSKVDFKMVTQSNGKWLQYDTDEDRFDFLIKQPVLNKLGYSIIVHPKSNKGLMIRNQQYQSVFIEPVRELIQIDEKLFLVNAGSTSFIWNPATKRIITKPKSFTEAMALKKSETSNLDFTIYPFLFKPVNSYDDKTNRIKTKHLSIFESYSYDNVGNPKNVIRQDYRWDISMAHLTIKNGYCYNYDALNVLVDSFPAEQVFELHVNNLMNFSDHPEFIPLSYSLNGKKGFFYLGSTIHSAAIYDEIRVDQNDCFDFIVTKGDSTGLVNAFGDIIVPLSYSDLNFESKGIIRGTIKMNGGYAIKGAYFRYRQFKNVLDADVQFVPSTTQKIIIQRSLTDKKYKWIDYNKLTTTISPYGEIYPIDGQLYTAREAESYNSKLLNNRFELLHEKSIQEFCVLPNGLYINANFDGQNFDGFFYSMEKSAFENKNLYFEIEELQSVQLIGFKDDQYYLFEQDGNGIPLPKDKRYKMCNYSGLLYYSTVENDELWGLMRSDGTTLTAPIYQKVFNFEGEHGIVWKEGIRYYIDKLGKTYLF